MTASVHSGPPPHRRRHRRRPLRHAICHLLGAEGHDDPLVKAIDGLLIGLVALNVIAVVLESVEDLSVAHGPVFHAFDTASVAVFSVEYLLRLWSAVDLPEARYHHPLWGRLRWMVSPMAVIDLLAVVPFYLGIVVEIDLRVLRVLRVLRLLKLTRYSMAIDVMVAVARQEARALGATLFLMLVVLMVSASLMYLAEHHIQPQVFSDIPACMWWAVVTLTTLGDGDMVPVTLLGRIIGGTTAVLGVGMIALPAGVLASGFSEQMRIRREEYREAVEKALEDGRITTRERRLLEETRIRLGLSDEEAAQVLEAAVRGHGLCPHCGKPHALLPALPAES